MSLSIVILAAGQGTRMRSSLPKVLHPIAHRPMVAHVVATAESVQPATIHVVYGHGGEQVRERLQALPVEWVPQPEQLGTGHAVAQALPHIPSGATVLVLYGDVPLVQPETLRRLAAAAGDDNVVLLTADLADPIGYGRIVRTADGAVQRIVEEKDATAEEQAIREVNTGIMAVPRGRLEAWLAAVDNHNAQGEYYLTDVVAQAVAAGVTVITTSPQWPEEILGVNDKRQLATVERTYQRQRAQDLMYRGALLRDPARLDVRGEVEVGEDVVIDANVVLEGRVVLGDQVVIGPHTVLRDVVIGAGTEIMANTVVEGAHIGPNCRIGPFARVRPETELAAGVHVGNFVEVKKATIDQASKVNHLSYIGDTVIGRDVNVGAGTITCNYDGVNKHQTVIKDGAFIGSDTQLVAPVTVGAGATIGAGSTITRDAPDGELTLSRTRQETRPGWKRPQKQKS